MAPVMFAQGKVSKDPGTRTSLFSILPTLPRSFFKFIYFWLRWVFVAVCGLSLVTASGGHSSLWCAGFSSCGSRALERRLSSCGAEAQLLHGMWDLPRPGLEPASPALAGGFPTTAPPGKPSPDLLTSLILKKKKLDLWSSPTYFHRWESR